MRQRNGQGHKHFKGKGRADFATWPLFQAGQRRKVTGGGPAHGALLFGVAIPAPLAAVAHIRAPPTETSPRSGKTSTPTSASEPRAVLDCKASGTSHPQMCQCSRPTSICETAGVENLLKLRGGSVALSRCQVSLSSYILGIEAGNIVAEHTPVPARELDPALPPRLEEFPLCLTSGNSRH
jgi:hypothetical protein